MVDVSTITITISRQNHLHTSKLAAVSELDTYPTHPGTRLLPRRILQSRLAESRCGEEDLLGLNPIVKVGVMWGEKVSADC